MIVFKKALSRRTLLRGVGAALALPLLDGMVPALTALSRTAAARTKRLGIVYVPNGIVMKNWTPTAEGPGFELTPILQPLADFRDQLIIVTGLHNRGVDQIHDGAAPAYLTASPPKRTQGSDLRAGISVDQVVAQAFGKQTQLASLELALEFNEDVGTCGAGYTCAYTNTICWRSPTTPLPMEANPRAVFERLLGEGGRTDRPSRLARIEEDRSLLDAVTEQLASLQRGLGARDRSKLNEYLESVRDIERRIQQAELQADMQLPDVSQPAGIPASYEEHAKLMFDLQVLAYQAGLTRNITFMMSREYSGRTYPEIGVADAHHPISHHQNDPHKLEQLTRISTYHVRLLAYYLEKLRKTPDGDGSLLDNMTLLYGGGISDGNRHSTESLPLVVIGGGAGELKGGRHQRYPETTPMANLHVAMLNHLGIPSERFGSQFLESTGELDGLYAA